MSKEPNLPKPDQQPAANTYIYSGADVLESLAKQQRRLGSMIERLTDEQVTTPYAPGKWTIKELLGHLTDTERIMCYRTLCIARGDQQSLPGFDEDEYVKNANFNSMPLAQLLICYHAQRTATIHLFATYTPEVLAKKGIVNGNTRSVGEIVKLVAAHEQHHLSVLKDRYLSMW